MNSASGSRGIIMFLSPCGNKERERSIKSLRTTTKCELFASSSANTTREDVKYIERKERIFGII
jgi:hypothetical protein